MYAILKSQLRIFKKFLLHYLSLVLHLDAYLCELRK